MRIHVQVCTCPWSITSSDDDFSYNLISMNRSPLTYLSCFLLSESHVFIGEEMNAKKITIGYMIQRVSDSHEQSHSTNNFTLYNTALLTYIGARFQLLMSNAKR